MGLSTHVLDTYHGQPAAGMRVALFDMDGDTPVLLQEITLNADGRNAGGPLIPNERMRRGRFRLCFAVAEYFRARGVALPDPAFIDQVNLDFGIAHPDQHYHVPLVCTPWTYSTYRGS
jgi:5-hydroxyisourate hydrolase